jgi:hypothetical protein
MENYCQCGCGKTTNIYRGIPKKFIHGHHIRMQGNPKWKGGINFCHGYKHIKNRTHPAAYKGGYIPEQRIIVEKILGKILPAKAVLHHVNGDRLDNRNCNLIICESQNYHNLLHQRERALKYFGSVNARKCTVCHQYDKLENLHTNNKNHSAFHRKCKNEYQNNQHQKRKQLQEE